MPTDVAIALDAVELVERAGHFELRARFRVPSAHPVLAGHFPGAPLVPGVLLLQAVCLACERAFDRPFAIEEATEVRFFKPVLPDTAVQLSARVRGPVPSLEVEGECSEQAARVAAFALRLGPGSERT
ncbi:MAG TPA: hypothetical protein VFT55_09235 [Planctomycetota bacterium]|nr:hypothetical protein [Planctomycetota bacterium]